MVEVPAGMVLARIKCPDCSTIDEFLIPRHGMDKRARGFSPEESFPHLEEDRRKQLRDHRCPECRKGSS